MVIGFEVIFINVKTCFDYLTLTLLTIFEKAVTKHTYITNLVRN